jgi:hypothetical protein
MASSSDDQHFAEAAITRSEAGLRPAAKTEDYEPSNTSIDIRPTPSHWYVIGIFSRSLKYLFF